MKVKGYTNEYIIYEVCEGKIFWGVQENKRSRVVTLEYTCRCGHTTTDEKELAERHGFNEYTHIEIQRQALNDFVLLVTVRDEKRVKELQKEKEEWFERIKEELRVEMERSKEEAKKRWIESNAYRKCIEEIDKQLAKIQKDIVIVRRKGGRINEGYIARRGKIAIMRKERAIEMYEELKSKSDYEVEWIPKIIAQFDSKDVDSVMRAIAGLTDYENCRNIEYWEDDGKTLKIWVYKPFIRVGELARALRRYIQIIDNEEEIIAKKKKLTPEQLKKTYGDERHEMNLLVIF
ncbi:MAG: hypothetical protein NZ894_05425 [Archaeoglobaceae archaeon]|nr:hypothetical protein [Archaeoglobaceae archaeon]